MTPNRGRTTAANRDRKPRNGRPSIDAPDLSDEPSDRDDEQGQPHNDEAERIVLGAMMVAPDVIPDIVGVLTSADYYRPHHATLHAVIVAAFGDGHPVEPVALAERLSRRGELPDVGGLPYLHRLMESVPTAVSGAYYAGIVRDRSVERRLLQDLTDLTYAVRAGDLRLQLSDPQSRLNKSLATFHGEIGAATTAAAKSLGAEPIDWAELWARDFDDIDWLIEPLIERGQSISLIGGAKAGKSLLILECVAALATGRSILGGPPGKALRILYVDQENTQQDIYRRLSAMGYHPGQLDNLVYLSFANLPPLNTPGGAAALLAHVERHNSEVVVLDTISRMVVGEENSSDTWLDLYRYTLVELKARRISSLRLDHHGKDAERGARGSSAKQGDIDAEWELTANGENRLRLRRTLSRGGMGDGSIELVRHTFPLLRHEAVGREQACAADIETAVAYLTDANAPADVSRRAAGELLRQCGVRMGTTKITEAVRVYKDRLSRVVPKIRTTSSQPTYEPDGPEDQDQQTVTPAQGGTGPLRDHRDHAPPDQTDGWSPQGPHVSGDHQRPSQDHGNERRSLDQWPTVPPPPSGWTPDR